MLAQCVCPARGDDGKEPIPTTGWGELFVLLMLTSVATIAVWEATRYLYRVGNRWMRRYRKGKRLVEVSRPAFSIARQEIAASTTSRASPRTPKLRRRATAPATGSPPSPTTSPLPTPTVTSITSTPAGSPPVLPAAPPLPQFHERRRASEVTEVPDERERVAYDTLQLMFCEDLRAGLRLQGLPVTALKDDLARRLSVPLVTSDVTNKQLRYVLFLWRSKSLSG